MTAAQEPGRRAEHVAGLLAARRPTCGGQRVVAVDGPSGSGKTTLAAALATRLGAPVVRMDDLYPGWDGLAGAVRLLAAEVLAPLARTGTARFRTWDWARRRWDGVRALSPAGTLVVEGVGSSARPAARWVTVAVWLEADVEVRRARGLARDGEGYRPYWDRWARQECALFAADATRERADVRADTTREAPCGP